MPIYGLWLAVWTYSLLDLSFADMFLKHAFNPIYDLRRNCYGVLEFGGNKPRTKEEIMKSRWLPLLAVLFCTPALSYPAPYTCTRNFYVATTGVDNASCGSSASPCATMQGADNNIALIGGDCVNVAAGIYNITGQINLSKGGNLNQANGYVTYIGAPYHGSVMKATNSMGYELSFGSSYFIIDGFEFNGNNIVKDYVVGSNGNNQHHLMVLNNLVHNSSGGGGVGFAQSDYYIIAGNIVYNNPSSWESGISVYEPKQVSGFNSSLAWDTQIYHIQILQNISRNNGIYAQPQHTDGNGITADDWRNTQTTGIEYPYQGLIQSNVAYGNGGQCFQAMSGNNLTIENNTCYNNMLDAQNTATWRGEITVGFTRNTIVKNNALYAVPGGGTTAANVGLVFAGTSDGSNVFSNNVTFNSSNGTNSGYCTTSISVTNTSNDSANCAAMLANNKVNTKPQWTNLSTPDFHPLPGSPLLGAGAAPPAGYPPYTIEGFAQPSPPNIGAFNHAGSPPRPSVQGPISIHAGGSAGGLSD